MAAPFAVYGRRISIGGGMVVSGEGIQRRKLQATNGGGGGGFKVSNEGRPRTRVPRGEDAKAGNGLNMPLLMRQITATISDRLIGVPRIVPRIRVVVRW